MIEEIRDGMIPKFAHTGHKYVPIHEVAIIGMAGRFPGADTIEELWEALKLGKETIRFFSKDELDASIPENIKNDPDYVCAKGVIQNADKFDAAFFELNPVLAALMDPQQRIFLEIAWELLEKTGYLPQVYNGCIAVYAGTGNNTYYTHNVLSNPRLIEEAGGFQVSTLNEKDYVATRTAYQLNLKGPAVSVHSSCSTSLLAVAQAVECIRNGLADVAIAGGASITSPVNSGHLYQEGAMLSRDGHCRSFDADASGTVFSDGAGVVLLKGLKAALRDGDTIYATIKGIGYNNDGGGKGSFSSPGSEGQAGAISMALHDAGVNPSDISYIETHGTATPSGDPVEVNGLKMAFGSKLPKQFCAIGSIKSNIGHLTAAAGVAGLIKTALSLHYRQIPPSLGFVSSNPKICFENSPFYVSTKLLEWESETVRRAGVSSFGVGGTNVHVVLEEFVNQAPDHQAAGRPLHLITWSAKSLSSLDAYATKLADHLDKNSIEYLADISFTLQTTRADFNWRRFVLAGTSIDLASELMSASTAERINNLKKATPALVFMFPGQGSQYLNMGLELYENEHAYKQAVDECAEILLPLIGIDIRQVIFPENPDSDAEVLLKNTRYTQPAIFVTEYALGKLWMSWGIKPTVLCGHSIGEFVAAHFAGIFDLTDALKLIAHRGKIISELPPGSMLSVRMEQEKLAAILPPQLSVAAINSKQQIVVAGEDMEISEFSKLLMDNGIANKILLTSHAFHSEMMDPAVNDFDKILLQVNFNVPKQTIVSTATGKNLTDTEAIDPHYWSKQLRSTVLFADAIETILTRENIIFVEVGPGNVLSMFVKQQAGTRNCVVLNSLEKNNVHSEYALLLNALGQLWLNGFEPYWQSFYDQQKRSMVSLPTYQFDRKLCWIDPPQQSLVKKLESEPPVAAQTVPASISPKHFIDRRQELIKKIKALLENASGIDTTNVSPDNTFLEMGLDSLLMTQVALTFKKQFGLRITFRQLMQEFKTIGLLANYLDRELPADFFPSKEMFRDSETAPQQTTRTYNTIESNNRYNDRLNSIARQLEILLKEVVSMQEESQEINNVTQVSAFSNNGQMLSIKKENKEVKVGEVKDDLPITPISFAEPPIPGAKLGRDKEGNPGWYVPDGNRPGKFLLIE